MMDAASFDHLSEGDLLLIGLDEALVQLDVGDLEIVKLLITECRAYVAKAVATDQERTLQ